MQQQKRVHRLVNEGRGAPASLLASVSRGDPAASCAAQLLAMEEQWLLGVAGMDAVLTAMARGLQTACAPGFAEDAEDSAETVGFLLAGLNNAWYHASDDEPSPDERRLHASCIMPSICLGIEAWPTLGASRPHLFTLVASAVKEWALTDFARPPACRAVGLLVEVVGRGASSIAECGPPPASEPQKLVFLINILHRLVDVPELRTEVLSLPKQRLAALVRLLDDAHVRPDAAMDLLDVLIELCKGEGGGKSPRGLQLLWDLGVERRLLAIAQRPTPFRRSDGYGAPENAHLQSRELALGCLVNMATEQPRQAWLAGALDAALQAIADGASSVRL
jgi:hypothetical protein